LRYALLLAPSANRVYNRSAAALVTEELQAFGGLEIQPSISLGGHDYLVFETEPDHLRVLANASSVYAFFELVDGELLRPVVVEPLARFDDDLITIPKYAGKTNEHFTKLLLNVTAMATRWGFLDRKFTVLDPVAGRGTTLNQAMMYGWDAIGIEHDRKDVDAYAAFLKTYLRRKQIKHTADITPLRREGRKLGRRFDATIAKEQTVTLFEADTVLARSLMRARSVDMIAGDLPYGVVHSTGSPVALLEAALPGWAELLREGGAIGLSWNIHFAPREQAMDILEKHHLVPVEAKFEHWVDQGITRDIVVARKLA
jgi:hypothetical protein